MMNYDSRRLLRNGVRAFSEIIGRIRLLNISLLMVIAALLLLSVLFVYSSCYIRADLPVRTLYRKQLQWALAGLIIHIGCTVVNYEHLRKFAWWGYGTSTALLVIVLVFGTRICGARRWLVICGFGFQPSEIAKLATIVALACLLSREDCRAKGWRTSGMLLLAVSVPVLLILKEPAVGTAFLFIPAALSMMFVAGIPWRVFIVLALVGLCGASAAGAALFLPDHFDVPEEQQEAILQRVGLHMYHKRRIMVFLDPSKDELGTGWNRRQSEIAVASGGLWGKGYLNGTQNILGFLPRGVAPSDFIYPVIAEEKGFVGTAVLLLLFVSLLLCGMRTAMRTWDPFGRLVCTGITVTMFCHIAINMAMTVGLLPVIGLPLPLLSYGGTFTVVTMAGLGIVHSVHIQSHESEEELSPAVSPTVRSHGLGVCLR